jgi:hypothetical protein
MTELTIKIQNLSSLLMNPMTDDTLDSLITGIRKPIVKDRPTQDVASERIYRDENGRMGIPTINLISAVRSAGRTVKIGRKAVSTAGTTTMFSFLEFPDEFMPFDDLDEKGEIPWKTDKRRGVMKNGAAQVAVGIIRPKFEKWSFTVRVRFNDKIVREEIVKAMFVEAGTNQGLCDFRPSKNGPFGRFEVVDFQVNSNGNGNGK